MTKVKDHKATYWRMCFEADAYPQVETALIMSPLTSEEGSIDYILRNRDWMCDFVNGAPPNIDSMVQLYYDVPEEAQWIPIFEKLLRRPRREK